MDLSHKKLISIRYFGLVLFCTLVVLLGMWPSTLSAADIAPQGFMQYGLYYRPATQVLDRGTTVWWPEQHRAAGRLQNQPVQLLEWSSTIQQNGYFQTLPGPVLVKSGELYMPDSSSVPDPLDPEFLILDGALEPQPQFDLPVSQDTASTDLSVPFRVYLDAGHGGSDSGAKGVNGIPEKEITLDIVLAARDVLMQTPNLRVKLSRSDDSYPTLQQRTREAGEWQADLYVSVHCNSASRESATGAEVFVVGKISSDKAAERAARYENNFLEQMGDAPSGVLGQILADLSQNDAAQRSVLAATRVLDRIERVWGGDDRGVRQAPFWVLRNAVMPSILVEVGFISNTEEAEKLSREITRISYGKLLAQAIIDAAISMTGGNQE